MRGITRRTARVTVAVATATTLIGTGVATAPWAAAADRGTVLRVAITAHGFYVNGPTTFPAGRVTVFVDAAGKDRGAEIVRFDVGYTFHDYRGDLKIAFENLFAPHGNKKKGLRHLNHAIDNTTAYGGLYAHDGAVRHGQMLLTEPGQYVIFDDTNLPRRPVTLNVGSPVGEQTLAPTAKEVVAQTNRRFGGDDVLPASGDITFTNHSTESPHFLELQHVKKGTSRKDVIQSFQSNSPPDFLRRGEQDSDALSSGQSMVLHVHLPPGLYAEVCFFPDPKTGDPHAFMGMVRMVHLK